jgi:hypothetical protein
MSNIRERLKAKAEKYVREEKFEVEGEKFLAIALMSGEKNRLRQEARQGDSNALNPMKFNPRLIARCIHDPATRKPIWNGNDLTDLQEIDALPEEVLEPMAAAASRVNGWSKEGVEEGKDDSQTPNTSSDSSSPVALVAA